MGRGWCGGHNSPRLHQRSDHTQSTTAAGQLVRQGGYLDFYSTESPTETTLQHFTIKLTNKIRSHDRPAKIMVRVLSIEFVMIHVK